MIKFLKGDLLKSDAQALVNAVNTVGVMGKGIALQFKNLYPTNYKVYKEACKKGELIVGKILVVKEGDLINEKFSNWCKNLLFLRSVEHEFFPNHHHRIA